MGSSKPVKPDLKSLKPGVVPQLKTAPTRRYPQQRRGGTTPNRSGTPNVISGSSSPTRNGPPAESVVPAEPGAAVETRGPWKWLDMVRKHVGTPSLGGAPTPGGSPRVLGSPILEGTPALRGVI
ncbi:hypothetical protein MRX96_058899 [Rhipicephalus microplus]